MASFGDFARPFGGAWWPEPNSNLDRVLAWHVKRVRGVRDSNYAPGRPSIEFGLINGGEFNAVAGIENGVDVIGLYLGQIVITRNLFCNMLSHPSILPHIGEAAAETAPNAFDPEQQFVDVAQAASGNLTPKDPIRADYAQKLGWIVRNFIVEHEFCHLFNGHIGWLNKATGLRALGEIGGASISGLSSINLQTLEMDADCYGSTHTLLSILRSKLEITLANPFMNTYKDAIFAIMFALYSLFRIFNTEKIDLKLDITDYGDHPPAVMRQSMLGSTLCTRFLDNKAVNTLVTKEDFDDAIARSIVEAEKAFLIVAGKPVVRGAAPVDAAIIDKCNVETKKLTENWKALRLELLQFKRGHALAE